MPTKCQLRKDEYENENSTEIDKVNLCGIAVGTVVSGT